jgi:hypothetical protein
MDLESRGIPGGYILTEEFREAGLAQARALGMTTIKVFEPAHAIIELEQLLGLSLQP